MKKLIIKIGNEIHELPYNGETFSFEVKEHYVPKVGDCVKVECKNQNSISFYWFKVKEVAQAMADFSLTVGHDFQVSRNGFFRINNNRVYTKITPEELTTKYAEAGYDWNYETDTIKPLKWMPKDGDVLWGVSLIFEPLKYIFDKRESILQSMLEKGLLFKTKEESQKFSKYCLKYFEK